MKSLKLILFYLLTLFVISCRENILEIPDSKLTGNIYINSYPRGADIFLNTNRLSKTTPDSLINLQPGNYTVKLSLLGYGEQTVTVDVYAGQKRYVNVTFQNY